MRPATEVTHVMRGAKKTTETIVKSVARAKLGVDVYGSALVPSVLLGVEPHRKALIDARNRGLKHRYVVDVTGDNLGECRELAQHVKLRHLDRIKRNFGIVDRREYMPTATLQKAKPLAHLIYSNVREIVEQQQYIFDTLWYKAIPFDMRVRQIEENRDLGDIIQRFYLCRDCMTPFVSEEDRDEHERVTGHTKIMQLPF